MAASCPNTATTTNCEEWPLNSTGVSQSDAITSFSIDNTAPNVHVLGVNGARDNGINADNIFTSQRGEVMGSPANRDDSLLLPTDD